MSEITIPKINSRQKGLQIQYYTTIPAKYSETGKRAYVNYVKDSSFGKIPARRIKKYHCDDFVRTLTNGTIVYSYVCQIKCIVSQAFDYACDREIMSWNFMRKVKINEDRCKEQEDKEQAGNPDKHWLFTWQHLATPQNPQFKDLKHSGSPQNRGFRSPEGFLRGG